MFLNLRLLQRTTLHRPPLRMLQCLPFRWQTRKSSAEACLRYILTSLTGATSLLPQRVGYVLTLDADDLAQVTRLAEYKAGSQSCYGLALHRAYVQHCYNP